MHWPNRLHRAGIASVLRGMLRYLLGKQGQRRVRGVRLYYRLRTQMILHSSDHLGRWTSAREVRVWVDGSEAFPRIERLLSRAQHTIVIQMFIWKDDETGRRIAGLLVDAADRGVTVDITKEAVGDFFEYEGDFLSTKQSENDMWKRFWKHPRIRISHTSQRDHAKVYVIDNHTLLLTGMNIADEYRHLWHDYLIELKGARFVEEFLTRKSLPEVHQSVQLVMNTEERKEIRPVLRQIVEEAEYSIVVEHCFLSDPEVVASLIRATHRGVRVTIILPSQQDFHHHANLLSVGELITKSDRGNMGIFLHKSRFHAKIILVDHRCAFVGSANLITSSIDTMGEVNVLIRGLHQRALWKLTESLREDVLHSRALSGAPNFLWLSRWLAWLGL